MIAAVSKIGLGRLIGILISPDDIDSCLQDDLPIQPECPAVYIVEVEINPALHRARYAGFAAAAVHLRPARDARFYYVAQHIILYGVH